MSNPKKIQNFELKNLVSDALRQKSNSYPDNILLSEIGPQSVGPGSFFNAEDPSAEEMFSILKDKYNASVSAISSVANSIQRTLNSFRRSIDETISFGGNEILQSIYRINPKNGSSQELNDVKNFFLLFGKVCFKKFLISQQDQYVNPHFIDPGIYCLRDDIKTFINSWNQEYKKRYLKAMRSRQKRHKGNIQNHREYGALIVKFALSNFCKGFSEVVSKEWSDFVAGGDENSKTEYNSNIVINQAEISKFSKLFLEDDMANLYFKDISDINLQLIGKKGSVFDIFPVIALNFVKDAFDESISGGFTKNFFSNSENEKKVIEDPSSILGSIFKEQVFVDKITETGEFRKHWFAFTHSSYYDPAGEKGYDYWLNLAEGDLFEKGPYDANFGNTADFVVNMSAGIATDIASISMLKKALTAGVATTAGSGGALAGPVVITIISIAAVMAAGYALNYFGFFTQKDEIEDEINNILSLLEELKSLYSQAPQDDKITIDKNSVAEIEKRFRKSTKKILLILDSIGRDSSQYAVEDEDTDMKNKRVIQQEISQIIYIVENILNEGMSSPIFIKSDTPVRPDIVSLQKETIDDLKSLLVSLNSQIEAGTGQVQKLLKPATGMPIDTGAITAAEKPEQRKIPVLGIEEQMGVGTPFSVSGPPGTVSPPPPVAPASTPSEPDIETLGPSPEEKEKLKKEIDSIIEHWKVVFRDIYNVDIGPEVSQLTEVRKKIVQLKKTIAQLNERVANKPGNATTDDLTDYINAYQRWQNKNFQKIENTTNTQDPGSHYFITQDVWIKSEFGLRSKKYIYSYDLDSDDKPAGKSEKYAYFVIGPAMGHANTQFFIANGPDAVNNLMDISEIVKTEEGNYEFYKADSVGVSSKYNIDRASLGSKSNPGVFSEKNIGSLYDAELKFIQEQSKKLVDFVKPGKRYNLENKKDYENEVRAINGMFKQHLLLIRSLIDFHQSQSLEQKKFTSLSNKNRGLNSKINIFSKKLHNLAPRNQLSASGKKQYDLLINQLKVLGAQKMKLFDEEANISSTLRKQRNLGNFNSSVLDEHIKEKNYIPKVGGP